VAQHRGKKERQEIHRANIVREGVRQALARAKYRNQVRNQPPMDLSTPGA
jgi:hypothetical protein